MKTGSIASASTARRTHSHVSRRGSIPPRLEKHWFITRYKRVRLAQKVNVAWRRCCACTGSTQLLMCHCEVLLYSGRSCCIEVVDRQGFFSLSLSFFCSPRGTSLPWIRTVLWKRQTAGMNGGCLLGLAAAWINQQPQVGHYALMTHSRAIWPTADCDKGAHLPKIFSAGDNCLLQNVFVQIRVIEVFSAVSAAVSPCPRAEVTSNEKDQLDGWTRPIAYAYWNLFIT